MKVSSNSKIQFFIHIILPSLITVLLFVFTLFAFVIPHFEKSIMDKKREMIKELTNTAISILAKYNDDEKKGILTKEQAQETAISRIRYLRYGDENKDYFWITDKHPRMIMHPYRPELNGHDLSNYSDPEGKKIFVEFVKIVNSQKQGYFQYMWQWKDDSTHIVPKLSYVKEFEPWGWIIGTGIYIEDVKKEISKLTNKLTIISSFIAIFIALLLSYISYQSLKIEKKRQQAEEDLKISKEKFQKLVETSTEGLMIINDQKITYANEILLDLCSFGLDEIQQTSPLKLFHFPQNVVKCITENDFNNISTQSIETFLINKDNKPVDVLLNISKAEINQQQMLVVSVKDISHKKQIQKELLESKERFKTLLDLISVGVFRTTTDYRGKLIDANKTALQLLGLSSIQEAQNIYILDLFNDVADKKSFRTQLINNEYIKNKVITIKSKQGELKKVKVSTLVVRDENNNPMFFDGIIEEVNDNVKIIDNQQVYFSSTLLFQSPYPTTKEVVKVFYKTKIKDILNLIFDTKTSIIVVTSEENEPLGYITKQDVILHLLQKQNEEQYIYEIMQSPIPCVDEPIDQLTLLHKFKQLKTEYLFIKHQNELKCLYYYDLLDNIKSFPDNYVKEIEQAYSFSQLEKITSNFRDEICGLVEIGCQPTIILNLLSIFGDAIIKKVIELSIVECGQPPVDFAFIVLGSEGRGEQTFKTDQDNAIIYEDVEESQKLSVAKYFLNLGGRICDSLNALGYMFCKGGIMAKNQEWNQPLSVWKKYFHKWINSGNAKDILDINIFFDYRCVYGKKELLDELKNTNQILIEQNPSFLFLMFQNLVQMKLQTNIFGNVSIEKISKSHETINLKEIIAIIQNIARTYSIKHNVWETNTLKRLNLLHQRNIINTSSYLSLTETYSYLTNVRLKNQSRQLRLKQLPDNLVYFNELSELELTILKQCLTQINMFLTKLSYELKIDIG